MAFKASKEIIHAIEEQIYKNQSKSPNLSDGFYPKIKWLIRMVSNILFYPFKLMPLGGAIWFKDFKKFVFIAFIIVTIYSFVETDIKATFSNQIANYIYLSILGITAFISVYAIPSSYCAFKISNDYIEIVSDILKKEKVNKAYKVDIVKENLEILENKAKLRVRSIKASLAFIFAWFVFFSKDSLVEISVGKMPLKEFSEFANPYLVLFVIYLLTDWYFKLILFIFNTAQFGCNEYKFNNTDFYD